MTFLLHSNLTHQYRYHAHSGLHRADGLYGGLIVHKPVLDDGQSDPSLYQYDIEQLLLIGDWYNRQGSEVLDWFEDPDHYGLEVMLATSSSSTRGADAFSSQPAPDSMLLNGRGRFDCSKAAKARPINCSKVENPIVRLAGGWPRSNADRQYWVRSSGRLELGG